MHSTEITHETNNPIIITWLVCWFNEHTEAIKFWRNPFKKLSTLPAGALNSKWSDAKSNSSSLLNHLQQRTGGAALLQCISTSHEPLIELGNIVDISEVLLSLWSQWENKLSAFFLLFIPGTDGCGFPHSLPKAKGTVPRATLCQLRCRKQTKTSTGRNRTLIWRW